MKTFRIIFIFSAIFLIPLFSEAQTLEEIISKNLEATGGKDNWAKIKTMKVESLVKAQGMEIQSTTYQVNCKAVRSEIAVLGMKGYSILTDTAGWIFMPFNGMTKPEPMTQEMLKEAKDELCVTDLLFRYKDLGYTAEYLGTDDVEGVSCHKVKVIKGEDSEITYYIDSDTNFIIKRNSKMKLNGQVMESAAVLGDYQKLDAGIVIPFSQSGGGMGGEATVTKVIVNEEIDPALFIPGK